MRRLGGTRASREKQQSLVAGQGLPGASGRLPMPGEGEEHPEGGT